MNFFYIVLIMTILLTLFSAGCIENHQTPNDMIAPLTNTTMPTTWFKTYTAEDSPFEFEIQVPNKTTISSQVYPGGGQIWMMENGNITVSVDADLEGYHSRIDQLKPSVIEYKGNVTFLNISGVPAKKIIYPAKTLDENSSAWIDIYIIKNSRLYHLCIMSHAYPLDHPIIEHIINSFKFTK